MNKKDTNINQEGRKVVSKEGNEDYNVIVQTSTKRIRKSQIELKQARDIEQDLQSGV